MSGLLETTSERIRSLNDRTLEWYNGLSFRQKVLLWLWILMHWIAVAIFVYVGPTQIFETMASWAEALREWDHAAIFIGFCVVLVSIPPLFGYGTLISLCGFAFGANKGWLLAATSCVVVCHCLLPSCFLSVSDSARRVERSASCTF